MSTRQTYDDVFFEKGPLGFETPRFIKYQDDGQGGSRPVEVASPLGGGIGFLQDYIKGSQSYKQVSTDPDIPNYGVAEDYEQKRGGPLVRKTLIAGSPFSDFDLTDEDIPSLGPVTPASMRRRQLEMFIPNFSERVRNALPNAIRKSPLGGV